MSMSSRDTMRFAHRLAAISGMELIHAIMIGNACVAAQHSKEFLSMFGTEGIGALRRGMSHVRQLPNPNPPSTTT